MNPSKKNKLYNKFLQGDISQAEMHELNQYALGDDFLFEAIEGASAFEGGNAAAIEELNARLKAAKKNTKSPLLLWFSAAAAMAILILAVNYLDPLQDKVAPQVAMQEEPQQGETAGDEEESKMAASEAGTPSPTELADDARENLPQSKVASTSAGKIRGAENKASQSVVRSMALPRDSKGGADEISAVSGKIDQDLAVTDEVGRPPASAGAGPPLETRDEVNGKVPDKEVRIEGQREGAPASAAVAIEAPALQGEGNPPRKDIESRAESVTAFTPSPSAASAKRRKASTEDLASALGVAPPFSPKVSIEGDAINSHLFQQRIDQQVATFTSSGEFVAEFKITEGGRVTEFKVLESVDAVEDEKIQALIETFKGWQGRGNKKIKILVN